MKDYKEKARWIPKANKLLKQIAVSIFSYLTLPFFKEKENGVREFFKRNYYVEQDELVFDGTSAGYFSKVEHLFDTSVLLNTTVVDLGCGKGTFLFWLRENNIPIKKYIGIDFSIKAYSINESCVFVCDDIKNIRKYLSSETNMIVMCNLLCYIDNNTFIQVLRNLKANDNVLIIDPAPNIFWDAHFNGVKPIYREPKDVYALLKEQGFVAKNVVSDYFFKIGDCYIFKLSYGIYAYRE